MPEALQMVCAWCGERDRTETSTGATGEGGGAGADAAGTADADGSGGTPRVSHGICARCRGALEREAVTDPQPVPDLHALTREEYDALPFGLVEIDDVGRILSYNAWEERLSSFARERVLGRNFFSEVAPCTAVRAFRGRFLEMVASGRPDRAELDFSFDLPTGRREVHIVLTYQPGPRWGFVLVHDGETTEVRS